jgi:CheY-like chemotaxis protein
MQLCFVVDDHDDTREGFAEYLRGSGFEVQTAGNAGELRALLRSATPAAIVMDVQMPVEDGWTLTREIKGNPRTREVRVLVVSASSTDGDRERADGVGADALIPKPCDPHTIVTAINRLFERPEADPVKISAR